jgi:hypothetical protein
MQSWRPIPKYNQKRPINQPTKHQQVIVSLGVRSLLLDAAARGVTVAPGASTQVTTLQISSNTLSYRQSIANQTKPNQTNQATLSTLTDLASAANSALHLQAAESLSAQGYFQGARSLLDIRSSQLVGQTGQSAARQRLPGLLASLRLGVRAIAAAAEAAAGGRGLVMCLRSGGAGCGGSAAAAAEMAAAAAELEGVGAARYVEWLRQKLQLDVKELLKTVSLRWVAHWALCVLTVTSWHSIKQIGQAETTVCVQPKRLLLEKVENNPPPLQPRNPSAALAAGTPRHQLLDALTSEAQALVALSGLTAGGGFVAAAASEPSAANARGSEAAAARDGVRAARLSFALNDYQSALSIIMEDGTGHGSGGAALSAAAGGGGGGGGRQLGVDSIAATAAAVAEVSLEFGLFCNRLLLAAQAGPASEAGSSARGGGGEGEGARFSVDMLEESARQVVAKGSGLGALAVTNLLRVSPN